jgi:hypothetical protein
VYQLIEAGVWKEVAVLRLIAEAQFIVPDWGDKVDYGIGMSYRPVRLNRLAGRYDNPYAIVDYIPQSGTMNLATGHSSK